MHRPHRARVTPEYDVASEPDLAERARSGTQSLYARFGKRALDLLMVSVALVPALAIGLPVALWNLVVFRDPSKVFFSQHRVGRGGRRFRMFKFRTMRDANHALDQTWFTGRDAARVTRFGRFLRNTHLDELPQLFNVFLGDMHLVGPRPEMPDVHRWASKLVPEFPARLTGRPGLTGRAQVTQGYTGASAEAYRRKLAIDVEYLESISLAGDLGIIARTIPWVLQGRGWRWNKSTPPSSRPWPPPSSPKRGCPGRDPRRRPPGQPAATRRHGVCGPPESVQQDQPRGLIHGRLVHSLASVHRASPSPGDGLARISLPEPNVDGVMNRGRRGTLT